MTAPRTLAEWTQFVNRPPLTAPPHCALADLKAMTEEENDAYDDDRLAFNGSDFVLGTGDIAVLDKTLQYVLAANSGIANSARQGLAISGLPTLGKTTCVTYLGRKYEKKVRRRQGRENDEEFAPVVYIRTPAAASPKNLLGAFANWLGPGYSRNDTTDSLTHTVSQTMATLGTKLVVVDEVQNLRTNITLGAEAATALKMLADEVDATFVYVGIDLERSELFSGDIGRQLKGRIVATHTIQPFPFGTEEARETWRCALDALEERMPLCDQPVGSLRRLDVYLHDRTGGSIGRLLNLLKQAVAAAIIERTERIDKPLLDSRAIQPLEESGPSPIGAPKTARKRRAA